MKIFKFDQTKFMAREIRYAKHSERTKRLRRLLFQKNARNQLKQIDKE